MNSNNIKMYKKYSLLFSILSFLFIFNSCDDILNEEPISFQNNAEIFSTEEGVETAINGLYQSMASPGYHGSSWHNIIAPNSGKYYSSQSSSQDATGLNTSPSNNNLAKLWRQMYSCINVANVVIDNMEGSSLSNRETSLGQAYFIRAIAYFDLVRLFGDVPLLLEPTTADNLHNPRLSKELVYQSIIEDFEKARTMLPNAGEYLSDRPTKYAANAFLAKVYLTQASVNNDLALWQKAKTEALEVVGKYSLTPTFLELFELGNENTTEAIFEIQYAQNGASRNSDVIRNYTPKESIYAPENQTTFGRIRPNKELFDDFEAQYTQLDPRFDATLLYDEYEKHNGSFKNIYPTTSNGKDGFAVIRKYFDINYNGSTTDRNFMKMRYADVLLMLAEIENELNGPNNAYQYINEVLTRARNTDTGTTAEPADWSGMSQDEFRMRIMKEREFELMAEGHEWFDGRRRGYQYYLTNTINHHNDNPNLGNRDFTYPTDEKSMLLPIPASEISGNFGITEADQNPGY